MNYLTADKSKKSKDVTAEKPEKRGGRVSLKTKIERKVESMGVSSSKKDYSKTLFKVQSYAVKDVLVFGIIEDITDTEVVISTRNKLTHCIERIMLSDVYEITGGVKKASVVTVKMLSLLSEHIGTVSVDNVFVNVKTEDKLTVSINKATCMVKIVELKQK